MDRGSVAGPNPWCARPAGPAKAGVFPARSAPVPSPVSQDVRSILIYLRILTVYKRGCRKRQARTKSETLGLRTVRFGIDWAGTSSGLATSRAILGISAFYHDSAAALVV